MSKEKRGQAGAGCEKKRRVCLLVKGERGKGEVTVRQGRGRKIGAGRKGDTRPRENKALTNRG